MSYNIDDISYIGENRLSITSESMAEAVDSIDEEHCPEICFLDEIDSGVIESNIWSGEGSGRSFKYFLEALSFTDGSAELVVTHEGGDSFIGIRVVEGTVTTHEVVMTLGDEVK